MRVMRIGYLFVAGSVIVPAATDCATCRPQQFEDKSHDHQDDADRPKNGNAGKETENQ
jgi:hypothetical protein